VYLNFVLEKSEEFKEVKMIIDRWKILVKTTENSNESILKSSNQIDKEKASLQKYTEERSNEILGYNNLIVELRKQLEKKVEKSFYSENDVEERVTQALNKTLEATQIKMYLEIGICGNVLGHVTIYSEECWKEANRSRKK
jgi:rubrerythrin